MNSCHVFYIEKFIIKLTVALLVLTVLVPPHTADAQSVRGSASAAYPYDIGGNVTPPVKVILAFLIFGMFLIAFLSLYLRKCLEHPESRTNVVIVNNQGSLLTFPCGLDRLVVESFPIFLYSDVKHLKIGKAALECAVCISEFADNERLRFLPKCHHVFHPDCIDAWLASHITCPVCRADLTKPDINDSISIHSQTEDSQNLDLGQVVEYEHVSSKLPRSHTTGHSLVSPEDNCERYTLRLPEDVRKHIVTLKRAKSCDCGVVDGQRRWMNPDRICGGRSELRNFTVSRVPVFIAKTESVGKSDNMGQTSASTSLPV